MHTAYLMTESESDFNLILELSKKLNFETQVIENENLDSKLFLIANESALNEWITPEEDEIWKNL